MLTKSPAAPAGITDPKWTKLVIKVRAMKNAPAKSHREKERARVKDKAAGGSVKLVRSVLAGKVRTILLSVQFGVQPLGVSFTEHVQIPTSTQASLSAYRAAPASTLPVNEMRKKECSLQHL